MMTVAAMTAVMSMMMAAMAHSFQRFQRSKLVHKLGRRRRWSGFGCRDEAKREDGDDQMQ